MSIIIFYAWKKNYKKNNIKIIKIVILNMVGALKLPSWNRGSQVVTYLMGKEIWVLENKFENLITNLIYKYFIIYPKVEKRLMWKNNNIILIKLTLLKTYHCELIEEKVRNRLSINFFRSYNWKIIDLKITNQK